MNSKNKEALWKQILDRLTLTEDDQALFAGESLLSLTVTTAQPLARKKPSRSRSFWQRNSENRSGSRNRKWMPGWWAAY